VGKIVLINPQADPSDLWKGYFYLEKRIKALEQALRQLRATLTDTSKGPGSQQVE